jgi:tetratricopeptide (TPR) repeat protein
MPKRRTDDVVHVVMTDHFIQRRRPPRDLLAPLQERLDAEETAYQGPVVPYYPLAGDSDLYVAVAQVKQFSNLKEGIPRLRQVLQQQPPQHGGPYFELAEAYARVGQAEEAIRFYEEAIRRTPDFQPAYAGNLADLLASRGDTRQAQYHYQKALYYNPNYVPAHYNFAQALANAERYEEARVQFEAAIRLDPTRAEAHNGLADMLALEGKAGQAIGHYERALALKPDLGAAHLGLGSALAAQGRRLEAVSHLEKAAGSSDAAVRTAAQETLRTLGP